MASVQSSYKQTNGYFLLSSTGVVKAYKITTPASGAGGSFVAPVLTQANTASLPAGSVLKDMGKTVRAGSVGAADGTTVAQVNGVAQRFFRKVQLLNSAGAAALGGNTLAATNVKYTGVGGNDATGTDIYNTFYIELPTSGAPAAASNSATLVYVPGMPGFSF